MADKTNSFRAYCEVCKGHVSAQEGKIIGNGGLVERMGVLTECGHIICNECCIEGHCAKCKAKVKQINFKNLGPVFAMNLDPNLIAPLTFQNQFANRFTNELVLAFKALEKEKDELEESYRLLSEDRDRLISKMSSDDQRRLMARGASARLGGHIADSPAHPGTPRHSSIITSPRMTTPGHSSRAASPGHLIVQTPLSGNRIVSSRVAAAPPSAMFGSMPPPSQQQKRVMQPHTPSFQDQRGAQTGTPRRPQARSDNAGLVQQRFGNGGFATAPGTPSLQATAHKPSSTLQMPASRMITPFTAKPLSITNSASGWSKPSGPTSSGQKRTQASPFTSIKTPMAQQEPLVPNSGFKRTRL